VSLLIIHIAGMPVYLPAIKIKVAVREKSSENEN